ncbi:type II toxin-antitoxin system PemK/MazF family toxin [Pedobacter montanisoli]|uniref:mRNA interferase n=1 Tax=Pedobacter montanisoli TaxID=2923277 RepID=A0ABS9ZWT5_9SPHI|nr:type II toxin-antitoxin system PemK/MazF family toxin [Pedobacter montanisoli]MCJ0742779.1 type II toxin-antitoxin system PemK/MazF family toxin [Pedobacter montanisoli]
MQIRQFDIWLANLNPAKGTEPGKTRPVVVVQTNLLNGVHPSSIICPITTNVLPDLEILRVHLKANQLDKESDVLIDQVRAIDNRRLITKLGELNREQIKLVKQNLKIVLDL